MNKRERLGSRLGFIMLSAGCAIGCGNVWKFPWMCGQNGGGSFMLLYILCLLVLGLPAMVMELAVGRAAQASPIYMYQRLEKPGHKWGVFGVFSLIGNIAIMAFYTVVTGWILYYFVKFLTGDNADFGFAQMLADPKVNVTYLFAVVVAAFVLLSFNLQGGLERVTKYMMTALLVLMLVLAIHSLTFAGAAEGLRFYLCAGFFQNQRQRHRGGHEPGVFFAVRRHGRHGNLRQLHRQGALPHGRVAAHHRAGHLCGGAGGHHHLPGLLHLRAGSHCRAKPAV